LVDVSTVRLIDKLSTALQPQLISTVSTALQLRPKSLTESLEKE
jgi:hypothetical protein